MQKKHEKGSDPFNKAPFQPYNKGVLTYISVPSFVFIESNMSAPVQLDRSKLSQGPFRRCCNAEKPDSDME